MSENSPLMEYEINLRIVVEQPPGAVVFGLQKGSGNDYETLQKQQFTTGNLAFAFTARCKLEKDAPPNFLGSFVQGPKSGRFIYLDIGTYAGQSDSMWGRRLKIPLLGITREMIEQLMANHSILLEAIVPGTGNDGGPNCGTVKRFSGWHLVNEQKEF